VAGAGGAPRRPSRKLETAHTELHESNAELISARKERHEAEQLVTDTIQAYEGTFSWRLTKPLRRLIAAIRGRSG
jgi:hypothetical protein